MDPAANDNSKVKEMPEKSVPQEVVIKREAEKLLLSWSAPARPFKRRDRQFYVTTFSIAGILSLILFFAEGLMPVLLIISLVFLYYVLSTVEPEKIEYKITNKGIKIADKLTEWQYLNRFWFDKRFDNEMVVFETFLIPGRVEMILASGIKDSLNKEVSAYIPYEMSPASGFDKVADWVSKKISGNS